MSFSTPYRSGRMMIEPAWIDYNGHFNMAYYGVLFDRASDEMLAFLGLGPDYLKKTNNTIFTLESHCSYLREMKQTDLVIVETQILDHDHKRVHYVQEMKHADDGWVACVLEVMISHVDLTVHKTSNFPDDISARIAVMAGEHKDLPVPKQVGHKIGIPRKTAP
jgi:acyl-CoA thioester hydrolase